VRKKSANATVRRCRIATPLLFRRRFEPGRRCTERQVTAILADDAPDHATRLLDESVLDRADGEYWRRE